VVNGEGHFLGEDETIARMETDYFYPGVGDRNSPEDWADAGSTDVRQRARDRVSSTLSQHYPSHIDPAIDEKIRQHFKILLPRESMQASDRWYFWTQIRKNTDGERG